MADFRLSRVDLREISAVSSSKLARSCSFVTLVGNVCEQQQSLEVHHKTVTSWGFDPVLNLLPQR